MTRALPMLAGFGLLFTLPAAAIACPQLIPLRPEVAAATPVVVRGEVVAIQEGLHGRAVLTVAVAETLRGEHADQWQVAWDMMSPIGAPASLAEMEQRYGRDIVIGLEPAPPDVLTDADAMLAQEMCGEPFLGSMADLEPMLREPPIVD